MVTVGANLLLPLNPSPPDPPPAARPADEIEDDAKTKELLAHLRHHNTYYSRAIVFHQDPAARAAELDNIKLPDGSSVLDRVENRPLELLGDFLAYPCTDETWSDTIDTLFSDHDQGVEPPDERLVTLPTRGVFAEAKLGHCNASEEIDNTRFWDWQQSPIPFTAPEIAAIQAATPTPQKQDLGATAFPQSLVNIVNPPNAPDPTGLTAALSALATPNIFRDMSGRAEVADLLKKLSDNTIGIAQAANQARAIQSKYGSASAATAPSAGAGPAGAGSGAGATIAGGLGGPRARPTEPSAANRDLQDRGAVLKQAVDSGLLDPSDAQALFRQSAEESGLSPGDLVQAKFGPLGQDDPAPPLPAVVSLSDWERLINFRAPTAVQTQVLALGFAERVRYIHHIEDAVSAGLLNPESPLIVDYYPVLISQMPTLPGGKSPATDVELLRYIRLNINDMIDKDLTEFEALDKNIDGPRWNSNDPTGATLHLDIHLFSFSKNLPDDNAALFVAEADDHHWIFSTMYRDTTLFTGEQSHPVSGNRLFQIGASPGGWTFFTRGADRPTETQHARYWKKGFAQADKLWMSLQDKTMRFINGHGGTAVVGNKSQNAYSWSSVKPRYFDPPGHGFPAWVDPPNPK